jgi:hypothetical protein
MPKKDAIRIFRSALSGKPLVVIDKTRARYVLYHSDPSSKLLGYVLRLMPRHPEHIDALVYYLSQHKASQRVVRKCAEILQTSPYEYVRGEMWHILARMMKPQQMRGHLTRAVDIVKDKQAMWRGMWPRRSRPWRMPTAAFLSSASRTTGRSPVWSILKTV